MAVLRLVDPLLDELMQAVDHRNHAKAQQLLQDEHVNPNFQARGGWTALQRTSKKLDIEMARILLENGADATGQKEWNCPLGLALCYFYDDEAPNAAENLLEYTRLLLDHGANANARDNSGRSLLQVASKARGDLAPLVRLLLERGADPHAVTDSYHHPAASNSKLSTTPLAYASRNGNENVARVLLQDGRVNPNERHDAHGNTPLHLMAAASAGHFGVLKVLLEYGAIESTRMRNQEGKVPFEIACEHSNTDAVLELYQHGIWDASISFKGQYG